MQQDACETAGCAIVGRFDADVPLAAATVSPREPQAEQFLHSVEHPEVIRPANHSKTETGVRWTAAV